MTLARHIPHFQKLVLDHIENELGPVEWLRLRSLAGNKRFWIPGGSKTYAQHAKAYELVKAHTVEDSVSIGNVINPDDMPVEIGLIDDYPVFYLPKRGIYMFGESFHDPEILSFWITTPAYPPGW